MWLHHRAMNAVVRWLTAECYPEGLPLNDFRRTREHLQPADVLLVEGRTRVAGVIQAVTLSSWSHSAIYLGRLRDLPQTADVLAQAAENGWSEDQQLLCEAELGKGTVLCSLETYDGFHLRICRPTELLREDADKVVVFVLNRLGTPYDIRQIFDMLRFFFPYGLLPRRWRSSLFEAGHGDLTRTVCSTLIARAFASVRYPILPHVQQDAQGEYVLLHRNSRLFAPRDFDYSPYFEIIKYPFMGNDVAMYRDLHWEEEEPSEKPLKQGAAANQTAESA